MCPPTRLEPLAEPGLAAAWLARDEDASHRRPAEVGKLEEVPGITLTVREMIDAMGRVAGREAVDRVKFVPDARIQGIVKTWPIRFRTDQALAMGFKADTDFESIVRDHLQLAAA